MVSKFIFGSQCFICSVLLKNPVFLLTDCCVFGKQQTQCPELYLCQHPPAMDQGHQRTTEVAQNKDTPRTSNGSGQTGPHSHS